MIKDIHFQPIENSVVIISKNLVQSQHQAYLRRGEVFVKIGSGFIGLRRHGTALPKVNVLDYDLGNEFEFAYTSVGRIVLKEHPDAQEKAPTTKTDAALSESREKPTTANTRRKK